MTPEEAMERARKRAAEQPAPEPGALEGTLGDPDLDDLERWARIHVDPGGAYSTRRFGGPITALKRLLLRLLRQQQHELEAQQTRFNVAVVEHLRRLERDDKAR